MNQSSSSNLTQPHCFWSHFITRMRPDILLVGGFWCSSDTTKIQKAGETLLGRVQGHSESFEKRMKKKWASDNVFGFKRKVWAQVQQFQAEELLQCNSPVREEILYDRERWSELGITQCWRGDKENDTWRKKKNKIKCSQLCKKRTYSNVAQEHKKDWTHRPQEEILCTTGNDRCLESEFLCRTTKTNQSHTMKTTSEQHGTNIEYFMVLLIPSPGINCMIADKYVQQVT